MFLCNFLFCLKIFKCATNILIVLFFVPLIFLNMFRNLFDFINQICYTKNAKEFDLFKLDILPLKRDLFMVFLNSFKLFSSNWLKTLKFILYYVVIWGLCFALALPCFFALKDLVVSNFRAENISLMGIFADGYGAGFKNSLNICSATVVDVFQTNLGLAIYGLVVFFVILPFFVNLGKYAYLEMLDSYMSSHSQVGFFSALIKSLKKSVPFALCKVLHNIVFCAIILFSLYGLSLIEDASFISYGLIPVSLLVLTIMFALNHLLIMGWPIASIVFDNNVLSAYKKGLKAVKRHFWKSLFMAFTFSLFFWLISLMGGIYAFLILIPVGTAFLCLCDIVSFFTSQGMRFYINDTQILTPKKLEEVDKISKTAFLL